MLVIFLIQTVVKLIFTSNPNTALAERKALSSFNNDRYVFDVADGAQELYGFKVGNVSYNGGLLAFSYQTGGAASSYYIPVGMEDALFGKGVILKVKLTWTGTQNQLYLNDALVQTQSDTKLAPNWTSNAALYLGTKESYGYGAGYSVLDDTVDEFTILKPSGQNVTNNLPKGSYDGLKSTYVLNGWSYDPDNSNYSNSVKIYADGPIGSGALIGTVTADTTRSDVNSTFGISGNHGFEFSLPNTYRDDLSHSYYLYGIDTNDSSKYILLTNSPASMVAPGYINSSAANSYDDAWQSAWVAKTKQILSTNVGITKTAGKTLELGDSQTYSCPKENCMNLGVSFDCDYGNWAAFGAGKTVSDIDTIAWMHGNKPFDASNGWFWSCSSLTAFNGALWTDSRIDNIWTNPNYNDAQFAVMMFNAVTDLSIVQTRINQAIAAGIVPIVSAISPHYVYNLDYNGIYNIPYNAALKQLAQANSIPFIDYYSEVLKRRPGDTYFGTLINGTDGVHPTAGVNGYTHASDPYTPGGNPDKSITGDAALNSGHLLRTWLTVQKMKEIKSLAVDGINPTPTPTPPPTNTPLVGDINLDHIVNSIDYSILNSHWFTNNSASDLNHDGIVNSLDYSMLNVNWFKSW
jgi:hypothetical protein